MSSRTHDHDRDLSNDLVSARLSILYGEQYGGEPPPSNNPIGAHDDSGSWRWIGYEYGRRALLLEVPWLWADEPAWCLEGGKL